MLDIIWPASEGVIIHLEQLEAESIEPGQYLDGRLSPKCSIRRLRTSSARAVSSRSVS